MANPLEAAWTALLLRKFDDDEEDDPWRESFMSGYREHADDAEVPEPWQRGFDPKLHTRDPPSSKEVGQPVGRTSLDDGSERMEFPDPPSADKVERLLEAAARLGLGGTPPTPEAEAAHAGKEAMGGGPVAVKPKGPEAELEEDTE